MSGASAILLVGYVAVAGVDWWAVASRNKNVEYVAKPGAMLVLIVLLFSLDVEPTGVVQWFVAALVLSLAGDVFLMLPRDLFVFGLGAFLAGHVAYIVGFARWGFEIDLVYPLAAVTVVGAPLGAHLLRAPRMPRPLRLPVAAYIVVISVMAASAVATGSPVTAAGAMSFMASDALIGWRRFVHESSWLAVTIIVLYHLGQLGIVLGLSV
jgi:uncharacterized membrane protein YhhN